MGLFTNNKKLCPICGSPTPRLLASAVEGQNLCKECAAKIDLPDGVFNSMTLDDFREYIKCYDANKPLRDSFTETYRYDFGFSREAWYWIWIISCCGWESLTRHLHWSPPTLSPSVFWRTARYCTKEKRGTSGATRAILRSV